jgi:hypothetical protein
MTAKEYLEQARYLDQRINSKLTQVESLRSLATRITTVYSDMPHNASRDNHKFEKILAKIVDLESEIDSDVDRLVDLKKEIMTAINAMKDDKYRVLLEMRYLGQQTWEQISVQLGYDSRYIRKMHGWALQKITVPEKKT